MRKICPSKLNYYQNRKCQKWYTFYPLLLLCLQFVLFVLLLLHYLMVLNFLLFFLPWLLLIIIIIVVVIFIIIILRIRVLWVPICISELLLLSRLNLNIHFIVRCVEYWIPLPALKQHATQLRHHSWRTGNPNVLCPAASAYLLLSLFCSSEIY